VLVNPGTFQATGSVYGRFDALGLGGGFAARGAPVWRTMADVCAAIDAVGNDLMEPARDLSPLLDDVSAALGADARVRRFGLSGSGATMFALVDDMQAARAVSEKLLRAQPDWWVAPTRLLGA
jgi:4-diphosphocytidyl-2-C-methyl-D-erythritol kinase